MYNDNYKMISDGENQRKNSWSHELTISSRWLAKCFKMEAKQLITHDVQLNVYLYLNISYISVI